MMVKKLKLQKLIFRRNIFINRWLVKAWLVKNDYRLDKRFKNPIKKYESTFYVILKNSINFKKSTLKAKNISRGVKGVFGYLK